MPWRRAIAFVAVIAACYLLATASGPPATLAIETTDPSPERVSMSAPDSVPAGRVEIELRNRGDTLHDAQLIRVDGDRTAADVIHVLERPDGDPKPRWLHPAGGIAATAPGETVTVTQNLQPGTYYVADTQEREVPSGASLTNAVKRGIARIEVEGESDDQPPRAPATITAREYGFDADGIVAGTNRVAFRNAGRQFHQAVAFRLGDAGGADLALRRQVVVGEQQNTGWVPVAVSHHRATAVLEGGEQQVTEMTFAPGRYLLLCFVSDRAGGAAQWTSGMRAELEVPAR